jgi:ELWxxDGT repeat protein
LGPEALNPLVWLDSTLLFHANPRSLLGATELWRTDGTWGGTFVLHDSTVRAEAAAAQRYLFSGFRELEQRVDPGSGLVWRPVEYQLWVTDGSRGGTRQLETLSEQHQVREIVSAAGGAFLWLGTDPWELWHWDGEKTTVVESGLAPWGPSQATGEGLVFVARSEGEDLSLWCVRPNPPGAHRVLGGEDVAAGSSRPPSIDLAVWQGAVYVLLQTGFEPGFDLSARCPEGARVELWRANCVDGGAERLASASPVGDCSVGPSLATNQDALYFVDGDGVLWQSRGTVSDTRPLVATGLARGMNLEPFGTRHSVFWFEGGADLELWSSDGTDGASQRLAAAASTGHWTFDDFVVFVGTDPATGAEPWITDGTRAGTRRLSDVMQGPENSWPTGFTRVRDTLFFSAFGGATGRALWKLTPSEWRRQ